MAAMLIKDEHLQETLPRLAGELLSRQPAAATGTVPLPPADAAVDLSVPGLDLQVALNALNGNRGTLSTLLHAFLEEYQGFAADARSLCGQGDIQECLARLHTLKGSAGMLGATHLPAAIKGLEAAPATLHPASREWGEFEAALLELLQGIRDSRAFESKG
jgi:HPt (histidine-containing phosphotransfer) domain-containing protein